MDDSNEIYRKICLDASIVIKLLVKEKDSNGVFSLLRRIDERKLLIIEPEFLKIEVYSVLRKKFYLKEFSLKQANTSLKFFWRLNFRYFLKDKQLLNMAYKLADELGQPTIYDSLYLALAKKERAVFITADVKFLKKAEKVYKDSFSLFAF